MRINISTNGIIICQIQVYFIFQIYIYLKVSLPETVSLAASKSVCWKIRMYKVFSVTSEILRVSRGSLLHWTHQYKLSIFMWIHWFLLRFSPIFFFFLGAYAPNTTLMHMYVRRGCTPSIICTSIFPDKQSL